MAARGRGASVAAVAVAASLTQAAALGGAMRTFTNPVAPGGQDPWVVRQAGRYHFCSSGGGRIWVNVSKGLLDVVKQRGRAVWAPEAGKPWSKQLWAPELHKLQGRWYIYVAASDGRNENHRMYCLRAKTADPAGAYELMGKVAAPTDRWAIDATVLVLRGRMYFVWSGWEGDRNVRQNLYIAPMSDPWTISGERVLISRPEHDWELVGKPTINEGPTALQRDGKTFIIYSASGSWTDRYCLGRLELVGKYPLVPASWRKHPAPVFGPTAGVFGPGHASFTVSPDGKEPWIIYHAAKRRGAGWDRNIRMQRFTWDEEGRPCFGYPVSEGVEIPAPSGEPRAETSDRR
ncbi:MAG: glycoside hydrolase family 43 protein [Planctomycetota bacterium]|jgi:GH43 family beta-xylosidase